MATELPEGIAVEPRPMTWCGRSPIGPGVGDGPPVADIAHSLPTSPARSCPLP